MLKAWNSRTKSVIYKYIGLYVLKIYSNSEFYMEIGRIKLKGIDITDSSFVGLGNNGDGELDTYKNVRWRNGDNNNEGPGLYKEDGHNFYSVMQINPNVSFDIPFNSSGGYLAPIQLKNPIAAEDLNGILYEQTGSRYNTLRNRRVTDYHFVASNDGSTWHSFFHFQKTPATTNFDVIESAALSFTGETFTDLGHFVKTII